MLDSHTSTLRTAIETGEPHSMVLYGPPGTGKTTIARIVATAADGAFEEESAVNAGRAEVRAMLARAEELAKTVAGHAPLTMQVTKEALRRLQARLGDENIDDLIRLAYGSADFREGMAAFLGKRAPKWSGA